MLKLHSKEGIRAAIRRRGNEIAAQMTDKQFFTSSEFSAYATKLADFLLRKHRLYSLDIQYDTGENAPVAYTDGKKIFWNVGNPLAAFPKLLERRFKVNMGILFHECGHKLFLDFAFSNRALDSIAAGKLIGSFPDDPAYASDIEELKKAAATPGYSMAIASIYANISNIISDGHDESVMKRKFPGFIAECIDVAGEVQQETSRSLDKMLDEGLDPYPIYCSLMLQYAKFGTYKVEKSTSFTEAYLTEMSKVESLIDSALLTDEYKDRWQYINALVVFLWPCLKKHFPEKPPQSNGSSQDSSPAQGQGQSGNGNNGQGGSGGSQNGQSSDGSQNQAGSDSSNSASQDAQRGTSQGASDADQTPTPEQLQQALEAMAEEVRQAMNAAPAPVNCNDKAVTGKDSAATDPAPNAGGLAKLLQSMTEKQAIESVQKELDKIQMDLIRNCNLPLVHQQVDTNFRRHIKPNKFVYDDIARDVTPIARNLISQMLAMFRELNEECLQRHKRFGPIIEATESYRPDNAFFAKKKLPDDYPDMAICLLLDKSGSMGSGGKIYHAQRTAILLEKFANGIGVPIMIAGHSARWHDGCELCIYTDFASAKEEEDRYSLGSITSGGCNRDGLALRICAEMLSKRPERVKLLVSISDGAPSHNDYGGEAARKDISDVAKEYRRKGLLIYGAAIDEDKEVIEEIYGKGFLSIQDLTSLPKTLVRLVRQQIV